MTAATATTSTAFPLDSFKDAAAHLRRPFTPAALKFKVQAMWPKDQPTGGLIVCYIDARLAVERLNLIIPHLWSDHFETHPRGLLCHLTVDGITRTDVGEEQGGVKGLYSDALKRAAVKFGVGVSLYAVPKMTLNVSDGHLKQRRGPKGPTLEFTPAGEKKVRLIYEAWLRDHGIRAFGEPLDHGDVEGAQGDAEVEGADASLAASAPDEPPPPVLASPEQVKALMDAAVGLTADRARLMVTSLGIRASGWSDVPSDRVPELVGALIGMERSA